MGSLKKLNDTFVDILGCPVHKGSTVLTNSPDNSYLDTLAVVEKVNKKSVAVTLNKTRWDRKLREVVSSPVRKLKPSHLVVVVDAQIEYNAEHYPEYMI